MTTVVDTNVLLGLLYGEEHGAAAETELRRAYRGGRVVVSSVVYAELAADGHFASADDLDRFLADLSITLDAPSRAALFRAGDAFRRYVDRRPAGLQCPDCGSRREVACDRCGADLAPRQHVAADFVIGGHAEVDGTALLSFDAGFYGTYFPSLTVHPRGAGSA